MKIGLLSNFGDTKEKYRLEQEALIMGHQLIELDLNQISYQTIDGQLTISPLNTSLDIVIIRGVNHSARLAGSLVVSLRQRGIKVFDNNISKLGYSRDKTTDLLKLAVNNIPTPDTFYVRNLNSIPPTSKYPLVIKTTRTSQGEGVYKLENQQEYLEFISNPTHQVVPGRYLIQGYIPYKHDLRVFVIGRTCFVMERIPQKGEFRANFSLGGSVRPFQISSEVKLLAIQATKAIGLNISGVDILIDHKNTAKVIEVNHTPGFSGMEIATGKNIAKKLLKYYLNHAS